MATPEDESRSADEPAPAKPKRRAASGSGPAKRRSPKKKPKGPLGRITEFTNHEVVGGLTVAVALLFGGWLINKLSCEQPPLQERVAHFLETRELLRKERLRLAGQAVRYYDRSTPLFSKNPNAVRTPLIAPDPSWTVSDGLLPISKVRVRLDDSTGPPTDAAGFNLPSFPFRKDFGHHSDLLGYSANIAELNAPNSRLDKDGVPFKLSEDFPQWHAAFAAKDRTRVFDSELFRATGFERSGDGFELKVAPATYFEFTDTCEALGYELAEAVVSKGLQAELRGNLDAVVDKLGKLPLRDKVWNLFDFRSRVVGVGVSTLFVRLDCAPGKKERRHTFYMHDRSYGSVSEAMSTLHVVPAGGMDPFRGLSVGTFDEDYGNLTGLILLEFLEELYNIDLKQKLHSTRLPISKLDPVAEAAMKRLESGTWRIYFVGAGFDPLNGKLEIGCCLVADCATQDQLLDGIVAPKVEGSVRTHPFEEDELTRLANNDRCLPAGALCLRWAARNYRKIVESGSR